MNSEWVNEFKDYQQLLCFSDFLSLGPATKAELKMEMDMNYKKEKTKKKKEKEERRRR